MNKVQTKSTKNSLIELRKDKKKYDDNKEIINNHIALQNRVDFLAKGIVLKDERIKECDEETLVYYKSHGSLEQKINGLKDAKDELEQVRQEYEAYDLYLRCMHPGGIAYDLLKRSLPAINGELAKVLTNIVDYQVFFLSDNKRLDIFIKRMRDPIPTPIEMASGAEKSMAAMAIRLALISVSSIPRADIFILDEPATAMDAEQLEGFTRILELVKSFFSSVLLISHLESLKDCADDLIEIETIEVEPEKIFAHVDY